MRWMSLAFVLLLPLGGCVHQYLQANVIAQTSTLRDMQYQQVMNNLAMFVEDPYTIPSQVKFVNGQAQVSDTASVNYEANWPPHKPPTQDLKLPYQRQLTEFWQLSPVMDPGEIRALRKLYQWAVRHKSMDQEFNKREPERPIPHAASRPTETHWRRGQELPPDATMPSSEPVLVFQALTEEDVPAGNDWLMVGKSAPHEAAYVGSYKDVVVWVMPEHREELGRFVMLTLIKAPTSPSDRPIIGSFTASDPH